MPDLSQVTISLTDLADVGLDQVQVRIKSKDKKIVDEAAYVLRMKQSEFTRMVVVNAAKAVLKEAGIELIQR